LFKGAANPLLEQLVQGLQVRVAQLCATTRWRPGVRRSRCSNSGGSSAVKDRVASMAEAAAVQHVQRAADVMRATLTAE
tara:strand:- start:84 stop:320 length:237 start_codon:yes stop_codon:yes gene_type:complete